MCFTNGTFGEVMNFYDTHIENEVIAQIILINPFLLASTSGNYV